jgi:YHS domain-containing protein
VVRYQGRSLRASVVNVLPRFDANTRTLKLRLDVENPRLVLRPDMFVDVELSISTGASLTVPSDAIVDTGLRKTVFVERGEGLFEPRTIETQATFGNRVVVTSGIMPGERIVTSGTFLIDSESRFQLAAAGLTSAAVKDPVCGMDVEAARGKYKTEHTGKTFWFCSENCRKEFESNPNKYTGPQKNAAGISARAKG